MELEIQHISVEPYRIKWLFAGFFCCKEKNAQCLWSGEAVFIFMKKNLLRHCSYFLGFERRWKFWCKKGYSFYRDPSNQSEQRKSIQTTQKFWRKKGFSFFRDPSNQSQHFINPLRIAEAILSKKCFNFLFWKFSLTSLQSLDRPW